MKQTTVALIFEKFNLLSDKDFKSWMLNNYDELFEMEKQQIIDAHGDKQKTKSNPDSIVTYGYTFTGEMYYDKTFKSE